MKRAKKKKVSKSIARSERKALNIGIKLLVENGRKKYIFHINKIHRMCIFLAYSAQRVYRDSLSLSLSLAGRAEAGNIQSEAKART